MAAVSSAPAIRSATRRTILYSVIVGAALLFAMPFVWLVVTSLKPIEQAMSLPPTFIPRAYFAPIDGVRMEVTRDYVVAAAGFVAEVTAGEQRGRRIFVTAAAAAARARELRVLHPAPAGGWHVTQRLESSNQQTPTWDIVPAEALETTVRPRWGNYPAALGRLGGTDRVSFWRFLGNTLI